MSGSWHRALGSQRLLVSGFGKWGGGVYELTSGEPVALDDLPTSGLAVGGGRLWRVLRAPGEQTSACELLSYDDRGVRTYQRLDAIRDPHDVCWHDGAVHVSASWDGTVWRIAGDGTPHPVWRGGTVPDSWHVNSLVVVDGRLHVCAFGRFDAHKAWKSTGTSEPPGFVHDIARGEDVLSGLAHPHTPRRVGDQWYVCESTRGALTELTADGQVRRRIGIKRYTRGLAIVGDWALVGGNANREDDDDRGEVVVVDLRTFQVAERIPMPCLETYDIVSVPPDLARGVALGFAGNPARTVEQHRGTTSEAEIHPTPPPSRVHLTTPRTLTQLATPGHPLDRQTASQCAVRGRLPDRMTAGETQMVEVTVQNGSAIPLATVPPNPIRVGARWSPHQTSNGKDPAAGQNGDAATPRNPLAPLPHVVHPQEKAETKILLVAPQTPGRYEVRVALYQPTLGWFGTRIHQRVRVNPTPHPQPPTPETPAQATTTPDP